MANETEVIKIQYDTEEAVRQVENLSDTIANNSARLKELKQMLKDGKISQKDFAVQTAEVTQELNRETFERKKYVTVLQSEIGSIKRAKAENQVLREERNKLNLQTVEGKKKLEEYNKRIDANTKIINGNVDKQSKMYLTLGKVQNSLSNIPGPLGGAIQGIAGLTKAAWAFVANPIGAVIAAIVLALTALYKAFKSTDSGATEMAAKMESLRAIMDAIRQKLILVIEWITKQVKAFKDWRAEIEKTYPVLNKVGKVLNFMFNPIEKIRVGLNLLKKSMPGVVDEFNRLRLAGEEYVRTLDKIDDSESNFISKRAENLNKIAKLEFEAQNRGLSTEKRRKALKEAIKISEEQSKQEKKFFDERLKNELDYLAKKSDASKKVTSQQILDFIRMSDEEQATASEALKFVRNNNEAKFKELEELYAKSIDADTKFFEENKRNISKLSGFEEEIRKQKEEKLNKEIEAKEKRDASLLKLEQDFAESVKKIDEDLFDFEEKIDNSLIEKRGEEIVAEMDRIQAMRDIRAEDLQQTLNDFQTIIDAAAAMGDERVSIVSDTFARIATINFAEIQNAKDAFLQIGQAALELTNLIVAGNAQQLADFEAKKNAELEAAGNDAAKKEAIEKKYAKKLVAIKRAQFKEDKAKAIIDAGIATALAVVNSLKQGLPIPGLIFAPLAAALGGVQIAAIARRPEPQFTSDKFAQGGAIVNGPSHGFGGVNVYGDNGQYFGQVEGNEAMFVMKKDATAEIAALSAINESYGGRSFSRAPVSNAQDGGQFGGNGNVERAVDEAIQRTPIYVRVGDIETGLTDFNNVKQAGVI